jgi:hypothetical protein
MLDDGDNRRQSAPGDLSSKQGKSKKKATGSPGGSSKDAVESSASIQVFARFRPSNESIFKNSGKNNTTSGAHGKGGGALMFNIDTESNTVSSDVDPNSFGGSKTFHYDKVFDQSSTQQQVYQSIEPIVSGILSGFNGTILSYGQTASGKTHTMEGKGLTTDESSSPKSDEGEACDESSSLDDDDETSNPNIGISSRAVQTLFRLIDESDESLEYSIKLSFVEIYCEAIRDLLQPSSNESSSGLKIKEQSDGSIVVDGVFEKGIGSQSDIHQMMALGKSNRATSSTQMNAESSRSHSLVMITVESTDVNTGRRVRGRLVLGDLAGSERVKVRRIRSTRNDHNDDDCRFRYDDCDSTPSRCQVDAKEETLTPPPLPLSLSL